MPNKGSVELLRLESVRRQLDLDVSTLIACGPFAQYQRSALTQV